MKYFEYHIFFFQGTGANFLLSGIYLTFLFSFVLLILTTAHFLVGAAMEKVKVLQNKLFKKNKTQIFLIAR